MFTQHRTLVGGASLLDLFHRPAPAVGSGRNRYEYEVCWETVNVEVFRVIATQPYRKSLEKITLVDRRGTTYISRTPPVSARPPSSGAFHEQSKTREMGREGEQREREGGREDITESAIVGFADGPTNSPGLGSGVGTGDGMGGVLGG
ncbi:hypothetical protein HD554DRAFT_2036973 [Boletus coccyginus]|nr:hypothetical protein HD554DRAFT_2036973 [Boletus coccyginus]